MDFITSGSQWLVTILVGLVTTFFAIYWLLNVTYPTFRQFRLISKLPGPPGVPFFGNSLALANLDSTDLLQYFMSLLPQYDRLMRLWMMGISLVLLKEPKDVQVLLSSTLHLPKGWEYMSVLPWLQEGLLTSAGQKWHNRRKLLTASFHFKILEDSLTVFNKHARLLCNNFKEALGKPVNVNSYITLCTLDVMTEAAMGIDLGAQNQEAKEYLNKIKRIGELAVYRTLRVWLHREFVFNAMPSGREFNTAKNYLHSFTDKVIKERRDKYYSERKLDINDNRGKIRLAFLDNLLEIEARNPGTLSDEDIREEVDTFMFEGHDTTSAALNFYCYNIGSYQDIQEKVFEELKEIFGDDMNRDITHADLQKMSYLEKTMKESLRLHPSVPYISRKLENDLILDGVTVPANANVAVLPFWLHRNEKYWPYPEVFDPERFSEENSVGRHPYSYIPFSAGQRNCIGQKFAMMELKVVAASIVRKFHVITESKELNLSLPLILRSTTPIICKFIPRN